MKDNGLSGIPRSFDDTKTFIIRLISHPLLDCLIHHELRHYLFAKSFDEVNKYISYRKGDYEMLGDRSNEEFKCVMSELYALWKKTKGLCGDFSSEEGIKNFLTIQQNDPKPLINLKNRLAQFNVNKVINYIKEFDEKELFENYLSNVKEELSKIVIQETKTSNTTINDLSEEDILKAEQAMEHLKNSRDLYVTFDEDDLRRFMKEDGIKF